MGDISSRICSGSSIEYTMIISEDQMIALIKPYIKKIASNSVIFRETLSYT